MKNYTKLFFVILTYCIIIVKSNDSKKKVDNFIYYYKNVTSQKLLVLSPSKYCKCQQSTVFFKYPSFIEEDNINENVKEITIKNKEYFVATNNIAFSNLNQIFKLNNIIIIKEKIKNVVKNVLNLYWIGYGKSYIVKSINSKYQRYYGMLKINDVHNKDYSFRHYMNLKQKFPKDFNYMPETYSTNKEIEKFKTIYKNYTISKENLWLIKPKSLDRGRGIRFLKNIDEITKEDIVTKYISDPLLINGKKYDLRIHVLVTSFNPLKIYLFNDFFARVATEDYDLNLNNLNNLYKHITNIHINKQNRNRNSPMVILSDEIKKNIKDEYKIDYKRIWEDIKDIVIKSLISVNNIEIKEEIKYKISSNNIFHLFGFDIMIDKNSKTWLIEINTIPDIQIKEGKNIYHKFLTDLFNIIGLVPYSHLNGLSMEGECEYNGSIDEAVQQSICEFTRSLGGFERIFPKKDNIDDYKKYFEIITPNNEALWNEIKKYDIK